MTVRVIFTRVAAMLAGILATYSSVAAQAQGAEEFYRDRSVDLLVGYAPGGFNDVLARMVARHMPRNVPGNPTFVVRNLPNAAAIGIANNIYNVAPKDGSVIAGLDRTAAQLAIRGEPAAKFDPVKFTWLGSVASFAHDAYVLLVNASHGAKTIGDLRQSGIKAILGTAGAGATNQVFAQISKDALGFNIDVVKGYRGTGPIFLAMQRGEVDGVITGLSTVKTAQADLWKNKKVRALLQFGRATRHPDLPDVPTSREVAPNGDALALVEFAELPFSMSRPFIAPPGLPAERARALKDGFMATTRDKGFVAELDKVGFDDLSPIDGDAIVRLITKSAAAPKSVIEQYNAMMKPQKK